MGHRVPQHSDGENADIRVRVATNAQDFRHLREAWDTVVNDCDYAPLHVTGPWISHWWDCFGGNAEMLTVLLEDDAGAFGLAPLLRTRMRIGPLPIDALRLIGNEVSARSEVIFNRRWPAGWQALHQFLEPFSWQFFDYGWGRADTAERHAFTDGAWPGTVHLRQSLELPLVSLTSSWEDWSAQKSRTFRKTLRKAEEKCADLRVLRFPDDFGDIDLLFSLLETVATDSWSHAAGTSIVSATATRAFFEGLLRDYHARGAALASLLLDGETPLAFAFGLAFRDRIYGLKTSYRASSPDRSLGTRVMADFVASCMHDRGCSTLDMDCITQHSEYKRRWANELVSVVDQRVFRHRPLSRLLSAVYARRASASLAGPATTERDA